MRTGARVAIILVLFGAVLAGVALAVATALGWALWRTWPRLSEQGAPGSSPTTGNDGTSCRSAPEHADSD